jgi:NADH-quinone oxidoreductase subunit M
MTLSSLVVSWLVALPGQPGFQPPAPQPSASPTPLPFGAGVFGFSFLLSWLIWSPVVGAIAIAILPNPRQRHTHYFQLIAFWVNLLAGLGIAIIAYSQFQLFSSGPQYEEKIPWLPPFGITYHLGVDGVGVTLLLLSELIGVIAVVASSGVRERVREYYVLLLLVQWAVNGFIAAQDAFVMVLFWGAAVVPLALLVGGWGGPRRAAAGWRLFGYWSLGTFFLLGGVLVLYGWGGGASFDFSVLAKTTFSPQVQVVAGGLFVLAACTRLPLLPFHGWARDFYSEAPVGVAVVVAGVATRMGGFLLLRLLVAGMHDGARLLGPFIAFLAAATVIYAAASALRGLDLRIRGAYLALVPGGVTMLALSALTPLSLVGGVLSLWSGGLAAALIVGVCAAISERAHARSLEVLGGLAPRMPRLSWLFVLACLALLGLPGLASFPAETMTFFGSFRTQPAGAVGLAVGLVLAGIAIAWLLGRVLFGPTVQGAPSVTDAALHEVWFLGLLAGALLWVGLVPSGPKLAGVPLFLDPGMVNVMNASIGELAAPYAGGSAPGATAGTSP